MFHSFSLQLLFADAFPFLQHPSHQNSSTEDNTVFKRNTSLVNLCHSNLHHIQCFLPFPHWGPQAPNLTILPFHLSSLHHSPTSPNPPTSPVTKFGQNIFSVQISLSLTMGSEMSFSSVHCNSRQYMEQCSSFI